MEKTAAEIGILFDIEKFEEPSFGFEEPSFGFEDPSFGYETDALRSLLERMTGQQFKAQAQIDGNVFELQVEGVKLPIRIQLESRAMLVWLHEVAHKINLVSLEVNPEKLVAPRRDVHVLALAPAG